ncbi:sensor histidine kinase [Edaphobacter flagellatus]|uniref:sensor histidine kinase n=1 Tax=Edaphobacter flagellatus TaxID=1933044 RepID=UPI0021B39890|nr:GAF domain-containing sensor histidine kinase [Edaphobacter flagellatus]
MSSSTLNATARVLSGLQLDHQQILSLTAHHLLQDDDPDVLCQRVFEVLREPLRLDVYFHFLVAADGTHLELASSGGNEEVRAALGMPLQFGEAVCGTVAQRCEWMHITSVQERDDAMTALIRRFGVRCYSCQPLIAKGHLIGTLSFGSSQRDEFSAEELEVFRLVAHQVTLTTDRRLQQEQIRRLEQLALAGRLSASLAHEVNNPLESLNTILYLLRDEPLSPEGRGLLQNAEGEVSRLAETVQRTLEMYRGRQQTPRAMDLSELLRSIVANISLPKKARLACEIEDGLRVSAVPGELRQVVFNLLINAAQFTPDGGSVRLQAKQEDGFAKVTVADQGPGISARARGLIFQPFYTTRIDGGTGVGLWISREMVERAGGTLTFESQPEIRPGTEFIINLPLLEQLR